MLTSLDYKSLTRFAFLLGLGLLLVVGQAHAYDVLCHNGNTAFEAYFQRASECGSPTKAGLVAKRVCRATLTWRDQEIVVAENATEIDLDMFGVDLEVGQLPAAFQGPVAAFQVKESDPNCCMTHKIYSLEAPPRLLRTLRAEGAIFSGRDSNFDGRVEIWTDDAAVVDGLEGIRASKMQFPPTCVLRFEDGRLLDVSSELQFYFDGEIGKLRTAMDPKQLHKFKLSDGKLAPNGSSAGTPPPLRYSRSRNKSCS